MTQSGKKAIVDTVRVYLFPSVVAILGMLIWRDVSEMRSDIKMLLAQSNIDKTKIENLEKDVRQIEQNVYNRRTASKNYELPFFMKMYFKPEEEFSIKKYIPKTNKII